MREAHSAAVYRFMRGVVHPRVQYPAQELKTEISRTPVPVPRSLALELAAHVKDWPGETLLTGRDGGQLPPWALERAIRTARGKVDGLPDGFRYHDLRHYFASLLIASWHRRQDRPGAAAIRERQDNARHLRAPVARPGRVHPRGCRCGARHAGGESCGLCAD
jgi:integrase